MFYFLRKFLYVLLLTTVRALQGDLIPLHQQHSLQSASIVMASFGDLSANGLVHYFSQPIKHIHVCFLVTAIIYTLTMMVVLIVGVEEPLQHDDESVEEAQPLSLNVLDYLRGLPPWLWRIGGTYALAFFALFCIVPNGSTWLGSSVLGGMFFLKMNIDGRCGVVASYYDTDLYLLFDLGVFE